MSCINGNSDLYQKVEKLYKIYCDIGNENFHYAMQSRPVWSYFYNDIAENYYEAAEACEKFFKTRNVLIFVKDLIKSKFYKDVISFKNFIEDPAVLEEILKLEELFNDESGLSSDKNGSSSEGNV
jgi:hypothetical protein